MRTSAVERQNFASGDTDAPGEESLTDVKAEESSLFDKFPLPLL